MKIYFWGDGCWCYEHEISDMGHKGNGFEIDIPEDTDEHTIDAIIFWEVSK